MKSRNFPKIQSKTPDFKRETVKIVTVLNLSVCRGLGFESDADIGQKGIL